MGQQNQFRNYLMDALNRLDEENPNTRERIRVDCWGVYVVRITYLHLRTSNIFAEIANIKIGIIKAKWWR